MMAQHHQRLGSIVLFVDGVGVVLHGNRRHRPRYSWRWIDHHWFLITHHYHKSRKERLTMKVTVGHTVSCSIGYLDTNGNPMLTQPTPDAPATWTHTADASIDTLTPSADGNTCDIATLAPGADAVGLAVAVGGAAYTASLALEIDAAPQVLGSVVINATTN